MRLLSVLKLWPIVETSAMSENDGTTVRQAVAHTTHHTTVSTWARYDVWFTPFEEKGTLIHSVSKRSCRNSGTGPYDTTTTGSREEDIILVGAK